MRWRPRCLPPANCPPPPPPAPAPCAVVLLARDTPPGAPAIKDLAIDLTQWQPLIEDRAFVPWLVREPSDAEVARARRVPPAALARLEEMWRGNPNASGERACSTACCACAVAACRACRAWLRGCVRGCVAACRAFCMLRMRLCMVGAVVVWFVCAGAFSSRPCLRCPALGQPRTPALPFLPPHASLSFPCMRCPAPGQPGTAHSRPALTSSTLPPSLCPSSLLSSGGPISAERRGRARTRGPALRRRVPAPEPVWAAAQDRGG